MNKNTFIIGVLVIAAILIVGIALTSSNKVSRLGGFGMSIPNNATFATTSVALSGSVKTILSPQGGAYVRTYSNLSGRTVYLCFATTTVCSPKAGYALLASTTKTFSGDDMWTGWVVGNTASGESATVTASQLY